MTTMCHRCAPFGVCVCGDLAAEMLDAPPPEVDDGDDEAFYLADAKDDGLTLYRAEAW
jgi:hypothetical protein